MMALQEWAYTGYVEVPSKDYALSDRKWTRELLWIISGAEGGLLRNGPIQYKSRQLHEVQNLYD